MLIMQKDSHHPEAIAFDGVGQVIKCGFKPTKAGGKFWTAFIDFDYEYKRDQRVKDRAINVSMFNDPGGKMIEWPKGTILAVKGLMKKTVYNGKEYFNMNAGWVHDIHDYAAAGNESADNIGDEDGGAYDESNYDPGF